VFPVRYELNLCILFRVNPVFKGLNIIYTYYQFIFLCGLFYDASN
jgi:hypothetical protein